MAYAFKEEMGLRGVSFVMISMLDPLFFPVSIPVAWPSVSSTVSFGYDSFHVYLRG